MKAVTLMTGTSDVRLADIPEPRVFAKDTVKMRVLRVGICGMDREEASGGRVKAPGNGRELVRSAMKCWVSWWKRGKP